MKKIFSKPLFLHCFYCSILLILSYLFWFIFPSSTEIENNNWLTDKVKASNEIIGTYNEYIFKEDYAYAEISYGSHNKSYLKSIFLIDSVTTAFCQNIDDLLSSKTRFSKETPMKLKAFYQYCKQQSVFLPQETHKYDIERFEIRTNLIDKKINAIQWKSMDKYSRFSRGQLEVMKSDAKQIETILLSLICSRICTCFNPQTDGYGIHFISDDNFSGKVGQRANFDFCVSSYHSFIKNAFFEIKIDDEVPFITSDYGKIEHCFKTSGIHQIGVKTYFQKFRTLQYDTLERTFFVTVKAK